MPIDRPDFDRISEADLAELVQAQVPEGLRFDYKRELYGNSDAEKREALKDISAFANAAGGHLVIGVEEEDGIPVGLSGVVGINPDDVVLRLDQLARGGLEPRIQGLRVKSVPLASGSHCFVVRVPRSWHPPHRVAAQNSNRYWVRNSGGSHEASVEELRALFTQGADAVERALQFRDERLRQIIEAPGPRPLAAGGRLVIHIVPLASVIARFSIDPEAAHQRQGSFHPIGADGFSPRFNLHGFVNERGGEVNRGYTQVYRSGIVEATKAAIVREFEERRIVAGIAFERQVMQTLPRYLNALRAMEVPAPMLVLITLDGVYGAAYAVSREHDEPEPPLTVDQVLLPECLIEEFGTDRDYQRALRPAIDALWNAAGYPRALSYNAAGDWIGDPWVRRS